MDTSTIPSTARLPVRSGARRTVAGVLALAVVAGLAASCSGSGDEAGAGTTTTTADLRTATTPVTAAVGTLPVPPGFVIPDTRGVALAPVESDEEDGPRSGENALPVRGGTSTVRVRVEGPYDAADTRPVVRFERHAGGLVGWEDVVTGRDGVAVLDDALGGRYRVRAWHSPSLAATESQLAFVARDETVELRVRMERHDEIVISGALRSPSWRVGDRVQLDVLAVRESVDRNGRVGGAPQAVQVAASQSSGAALEGESVLTTDPGSGRGSFTVRCDLPGSHQVDLSGDGGQFAVVLPECLPAVATTTTVDSADGGDEDDDSTSTTRPRTTTTRQRTTTTRPGADR